MKLSVTPTAILVQAICGPAGDGGSNQSDLTCSAGDVFDDVLIDTSALVGVAPGIAPGVAFAIELVSPNPSAGDMQVAFSLPDQGPATVERFDVTGRVLMQRELGAPGAGNHRITLARDSALPAGTYWLRLRQPGRSTSSKVIFVH